MIVRFLALTIFLLTPIRPRSEPILHEFVPSLPHERFLELEQDDQPTSENEPVLRPQAISPFRPDTHTTRDGLLSYYEPFSPAISPFKRGEALDQVGHDYSLSVTLSELHLVSVQAHDQGGEIFRGSFLVQLDAGQIVPFPSVAPNQQLRALDSDPQTNLEILRDAADNYFLRSDTSGRYRVTITVEAPASYFSPRVFPDVTPTDVSPDLQPHLPTAVASVAEQVLSRLEINREMALEHSLFRLVSTFRAFESGPVEKTTGDPYLDLALGGRGVCRHRTFAFVVTAQALGLPARYVSNEAHAFAEVFLPRSGWARIDLGGDALRMELQNASQKTLHQAGVDPFPQPLGFTQGYSRVLGDGAPLDAAAPRQARWDERSLPVQQRDDENALPRITNHETTGIRGDVLVVEGAGTVGTPIEVLLSPDGAKRGLSLGTTLVDSRGRFRLQTIVPRDTPVGSYELVAISSDAP